MRKAYRIKFEKKGTIKVGSSGFHVGITVCGFNCVKGYWATRGYFTTEILAEVSPAGVLHYKVTREYEDGSVKTEEHYHRGFFDVQFDDAIKLDVEALRQEMIEARKDQKETSRVVDEAFKSHIAYLEKREKEKKESPMGYTVGYAVRNLVADIFGR